MRKASLRFGPPLVLLAMILSDHSSAHDVITTPITFSGEISRLVYRRCAACHRPGGSAFSLLKYEEARPWAKAIKEEVLERRMPPWGAVKGFGEFQDDQGLTQEQLELIADWVEGGAPEGDPKFLPRIPDFPPATPARAEHGGIAVNGELTLKAPIALAGVRARGAEEGSSFMAVAQLPDGSVEPLIWIYNYKAKFNHPFWYSASLRLPAGAIINIEPRGGGELTLMTRAVTQARP
ncbi:MAG TPA: cytochrome c [Bryobacteraceae bacterium]|nr:cytochrome c [Bryobacteraceae bacterium]